MKRITYHSDNGTWGIEGFDIQRCPRELYGALCKLKDYEDTGMSPDDTRKLDELYLDKCKEVNTLRDELEEYRCREYERAHRQLEVM